MFFRTSGKMIKENWVAITSTLVSNISYDEGLRKGPISTPKIDNNMLVSYIIDC
jgi:hypothetical protein